MVTLMGLCADTLTDLAAGLNLHVRSHFIPTLTSSNSNPATSRGSQTAHTTRPAQLLQTRPEAQGRAPWCGVNGALVIHLSRPSGSQSFNLYGTSMSDNVPLGSVYLQWGTEDAEI